MPYRTEAMICLCTVSYCTALPRRGHVTTPRSLSDHPEHVVLVAIPRETPIDDAVSNHGGQHITGQAFFCLRLSIYKIG
jgi:hypothetical protein